MKILSFIATLALTSFSVASTLKYSDSTKKIDSVVLNESATLSDGTTLKLIGAGLRNKKVAITNIKVYVLQLFSDKPESFVRDAGALASLSDGSSQVALKISMLRTVDAASLANSFKEAVLANKYEIEGDLKSVLSTIELGASAEQGKSLTLLMAKNADPSKVSFIYEDATGKEVASVYNKDLITKILSMWLGVPVDKSMDDLKTQLLKVP